MSQLLQLRLGSASNRIFRALEEDFYLVRPLPVLDFANSYAILAPDEGESSRLRRICLDRVIEG